MNGVQVVQISPTAVELRWKSSSSNDMIADSALALLLGIDGSPATAKRKCIFLLSSILLYTTCRQVRGLICFPGVFSHRITKQTRLQPFQFPFPYRPVSPHLPGRQVR